MRFLVRMRIFLVLSSFCFCSALLANELERGISFGVPCDQIAETEGVDPTTIYDRENDISTFLIDDTYRGYQAEILYVCTAERWGQSITFGPFENGDESANEFIELVKYLKIKYGAPKDYYYDLGFFTRNARVLSMLFYNFDLDMIYQYKNLAIWDKPEFEIITGVDALFRPEDGEWFISLRISSPGKPFFFN